MPMFAYGLQGNPNLSMQANYGPNFVFQANPPLQSCIGYVPTLGGGIIAQSPHTLIIEALLGDGSVRGVQQGISSLTWWQACTPAGGEVLGNDW
jgi:hypothetical protein